MPKTPIRTASVSWVPSRAIAGTSAPTESVPAVRAAGGTETILLVEDDATVRAAVRRMLERGGYAVLESGRAADALRLLDESGPGVALVLADVVLPDVGAGALVPRIRERHRDVRILLMSGYSDNVIELQGRNRFPFIRKPFIHAMLIERIRSLVESSEAATGS